MVFILRLVGEHRVAQTANYFRPFASDEIDYMLSKKNRFAETFQQKWQDMKLDAIICPAYPLCAFKSTDTVSLGALVDYNMIWNVLHYPAGVVPITEVQKGEDEIYEDGINNAITKAIRQSIKGSVGIPMGIQVATPTWQDEKCLGVMKVIDEAIKFRKQRFVK